MQKSFSKLQARTQQLLREYSEKEVFLQICIWFNTHTDGGSSFTAFLFSKIHQHSYVY